jgi:UDP-galactopyranose mutase
MQILIGGSGFSGAVSARIFAENGFKVVVVERRSHIAGNAYDYFDENGILVHKYGPHIFHTNSKKIFAFLSRFTDWKFYEHRVLAKIGEQFLPIPINQTTINELYGLSLDEKGIELFLANVAEHHETIENSEQVVMASVGRDLCKKFYSGYTLKQWGRPLSELKASVAARIPVRTTSDDRYFTDTYQFMPAYGYTKLFSNLLNHQNIDVILNSDFFIFNEDKKWLHKIFTGSLDEYFNYRLGKLPYRSLIFKHEHLPEVNSYQSAAQINFPNDYDYTRIVEFKKITGQKILGTSILFEYPSNHGDPYYPIPTDANHSLFEEYQKIANLSKNTSFIGRLAEYKYYNMDQAIASSIQKTESLIDQLRR